MKVTTDDIDSIAGITTPIRGGGTAGLKYETIKSLKKVEKLARLDKDNALLLARADDGSLMLNTTKLP